MASKLQGFKLLHPSTLNKKDFIYLFLERWKGGRETLICERNIDWLPPTPWIWDLAHNPGMCPDLELNWQPSALRADTQPTEPRWSGLYQYFLTAHNTNSAQLYLKLQWNFLAASSQEKQYLHQ